MDKEITCINCPVGCRLNVTLTETGEFVSVRGNGCPRGARYAEQECTLPTRIITAVIPVKGSTTPLSVKTSAPVPKVSVPEIMKILGGLCVACPVAMGQVIVPDLLHTGADLIATRDVSG